ncbi:MAG: InlB B-repeat-containing protein, partial [Lachnospiraceae bacterium]|nr:InlB B-repeat-containing protein [Lachnospiraceae bacterium]
SIEVDGQGQEVGDYDLTPKGAVINDDISDINKYDVTYVNGKLHITSDEKSYNVTFKVKNGAWNDGTKADKKVTLSGNAGDTLKLSADQIPAAGSKPDADYKEGRWDVTPDTKIAITADTTYTYTYANDGPLPDKYTISFDANGGTGEMAPQKADKGETVQLKANEFTRSGYFFKNWNTKPDGFGESYDDKQPVKLENDMTLYAQWTEDKPEEYTVTVTVSPKKSGTAKASVNSGKTGTKVTLKAVSKAGYKFKKWKVVSGGVKLADATKTKTTLAIKDANVKVKAIFEKIYEAPQPEIEPVGDDGIILAWWKVKEAEGYDIFMSRCNHGGKEISPKLVKTIEENETLQWTATGLKPNKSYKAYIKAFVTDKNGKKKYISKSPLMHVYTAGGNRAYTNAKSVKLNTSDGMIKKGNKLTLKVKDTYKIKASVRKADKKKKLLPDSHVKTLRYRSSDPGVATVSSKGKITAKKKGKCNIYVYAHNGVNKTIKLTVK